MTETPFVPRRIYVDKTCRTLPLTKTVLENAPDSPVVIVEDVPSLIRDVMISGDPFGQGKKDLLITRSRGSVVKPCPCTPGYLGCGYFNINLDLNCPLDCSYCILQLYLENPLVTVHAGFRSIRRELDRFIREGGRPGLRIGTGELGDSLALDHLTGRSETLSVYFKSKPGILFELKTKTLNTQRLLDMEPAPNIIVSWSLNSEAMAAAEEMGAPAVESRLEAAGEISRRGYRIGFHFDPLILYPGWEEGYESVVNTLFQRVRPEQIAWISLGGLRFPPDLSPVIRLRFPQSPIIHNEMIKGLDGKMRYFRPLRVKMFRRLVELLRDGGGKGLRIYLCMESREVWEQVMKKKPRDEDEVQNALSSSLGSVSMSSDG